MYSKRLVALTFALCALCACAVAYAWPVHAPSWHDLLGQSTGGSFGGSSWGSGGGASNAGGSASGGSSGSGGGIVDAIVGLLFELVLELLWQAFAWCLTEYPAPTIAVLATLALFAWGSRAPVGSLRDAHVEGEPRLGAELGSADEAVLRDLARATTLVGRAGFGFSGVLAITSLLTCTRRDAHTGMLLAGLFEAGAGVASAVASWRVLRASESIQKVVDTTGSDLDHLSTAVDHLRRLFEWAGGALAILLAALAVLVVVLFSLGA